MAQSLFVRSYASLSPKASQHLQRQIIPKFKITTKPMKPPNIAVNRLNHLPIRKLTKSVPIKQLIDPQHNHVHLKLYNVLANNANGISKRSGIFKLVTQAYATRTHHFGKFIVNKIDGIFQRHPLLAGVSVAATKAVLADLVAQTLIEQTKLSDLNWKRMTLFAVLGTFYNGFCVYGVYAKLYPKIFSPFQHWARATRTLTQTSIDALIHATFVYFPTFYALKACIFDGFALQNIRNALETYFCENFWDDFNSTMKVWFPCTLIAFGYVPPYLRTPYMALISFLWVIVMSVTRGAEMA